MLTYLRSRVLKGIAGAWVAAFVFAPAIVALTPRHQHSGPTLTYVVAPRPPMNSVVPGVVVLSVVPSADGTVSRAADLVGIPPFLEPSISAARDWRFEREPRSGSQNPVSATFVYRTRQILNTVGDRHFSAPPPAVHAPPLPSLIVEPPYPVNSTAEGVVVMEIKVDANGQVREIRTILDVPSLTAVARDAVQQWKFFPANRKGKAAAGTAVVAISFLRPVLL